MTTCEIACQTEKVRKGYYYPEAIKRYRAKIKETYGTLYTETQKACIKRYNEKKKLQKQQQKELKKSLKSQNEL